MDALSEGYEIEDDVAKKQRAAELEAEYGTLGGKAATVAEGLLRGGSLGATDAIGAGVQGAILGRQLDAEGYQAPQLTPEARARIEALNKTRAPGQQIDANPERSNFAIGYDTARNEQDTRREANKGLALGSEITGAVLPTLLSGGTSALARGAAATPVAALERFGAGVTKSLAGEAPGLLRSAGAGLVGGVTEGGIAALASQASQMRAADIENPEQAAESLAWALGTGALLGGAIGGTVGGISGGASRFLKGSPKARGALDAVIEPPPANPVAQRLGALDQLDAAPPVVPGVPREAAEQAVDQEAGALLDEATKAIEQRPLTAAALPEPPRGKWQAKAEQAAAANGKFDEAVQEGTGSIRAQFDEALRAMNQIDEYGGIAAKQRANTFNVGHPVDATPINDLLDGIESEIASWRAGRSRQGLASGGGLSALENVGKQFKEVRALANKAMARGEIGEAYSQVDQGIKGFLGKARSSTKAEPVRDLIERVYPQVQNFLEDESTWGELAQRQKLANPSWSNRIGMSQDGRVQGFTTVSGERQANGWDNIRLANAGAIKSLLGNVGDAGSADVEEAFRGQLRAMARDATDRTRAWGGKGLRDEAKKVVGAVQGIEDQMDRVALLRRDKLAHEASLKGSTIEMVGQLASNLGGGPMAAAVQAGVQAKRKLVEILGQQVTPEARALVQSAIPPPTQVEGAVGAAQRSLGERVTASAATMFRTVAAAGRGAPIAASVAGSGMLSEQRHQEAVQNALALTNPGSPQTQQLLETAAQLEKENPQLADAFVQKQIRDASYIASKLPKPAPPGVMWGQPQQQDPITDRKNRRIVGAVRNPLQAIQRLAEGVGSPDEQEAVRTLNPAMFAAFQQSVKAELAKLKNPPDLQTRLRVAYATGLVTDPTLAGDSLRFAQATASMPDQQKAEEAKLDLKNKMEAAKMGPGAGGKFAKFRDANSVYAGPVDSKVDRR